MTVASIIDGKAIAEQLRKSVASAIAELKSKHGFVPALAVVVVGDDPASQIYVRNKKKQTEEAGMVSIEHRLPATSGEAEVLEMVRRLSADNSVDGILVQLPLPSHIDSRKVIEAIDPAKDVDGFHPVNVGKLVAGERTLVPCTPAGALILAKSAAPATGLKGLEAVVVGRSNIVGKPLAMLLLREDCTVTLAHSKTRNLESIVARADILVAALGRPNYIKGEWVKPGAIVIDVGINRIEENDGKSRIVGDIDYAAASKRAGAMTPVPGGVGPMTIACLLRNTVEAACVRRGIAIPGVGF